MKKEHKQLEQKKNILLVKLKANTVRQKKLDKKVKEVLEETTLATNNKEKN